MDSNIEEFITLATMGPTDATYYAVFADKRQGPPIEVTDVINRSTTGITGTTYSEWSDKTSNSEAFYAGITAGSYESIQMRTSDKMSGIVSTMSGGKTAKIQVSWNSNTASGRTLDIYGKNSAYSAASDLYNSSNQGTKLGSIVYGTSTELTVDGDYTFIGLRSKKDPMYLTSISISWNTVGPDIYSGYCTTIPVTTITLNAACTDGDMVYGTYSNSSAFVVSDDIVVSEVGIVDGKLLVKEYETGAVVPANTGVLVSTIEEGDYTVTLTSLEGTSVLGDDNKLRPTGGGITAAEMAAADADCLYYRLTMQDGTQIGFWWGAEDGAAFAIAANKAYLAVPEESEARTSFWLGENTGIADTVLSTMNSGSVVYDLQGRRVVNATKGLYIVEGKKVLVK